MKCYRGFNNNYPNLGVKPDQKGIWMTEDYDYAKQYANMFKNGAIAEIEVDDRYIILASENECFEIFGDEFDELGGDVQWDNEVCDVLKEKGYDGFVFDDYGVYCYYIFNRNLIKGYKIIKTFKNDREDAMEGYNKEINDVLKHAGVQLDEREDLTKFNRIAGFYHYDTKQFELFPRTTEEISTEDDEINDYIHRISSKKELSERHVVRFGIEDIPGEGVICYIEGDTKRNAEECYYAIMDEYQEQCDIIKYEIEYYVGSSKKMIEFDAYGNQIMESVDRLDEKVIPVNKDLTDTKLVTSAYELNKIIKNNTELRILYDKEKNWFLLGNGENSIHVELINDALLDGIYPPVEWNGHIINGQGGDGTDDDGSALYQMNPKRFVLFRTSSDQLNGEDFYYDRYKFCYVYKDYCVFARDIDFEQTPLYKLLGEPIELENIGDIDADEGLNESVGGDYLFHGTKLDVLFQILKDNVLQGSESTSGGGYNPYGVSTSRDLNFAYNFADISLHLNGDQDESCRCVIILDKNKLRNRYKIIPFRDENAFDIYDDDNTLYPELLEKEEIVLGDIQNVRNYIVGIYVSPDCKEYNTPEELFKYYYNYSNDANVPLNRNELKNYTKEYADIIKIILNAKTFTNGRSQYNLINNITEAVNKGIDFIAYHGGVEPDMIPAKDRPLYLTDSFELAHKFAKREIWNDGLYAGEIPTVFTFKGHFNNPYYMTLDEYNDEGQDSNIDIQKWIEMGVDGIVLPPNEEGSTTYYIVIDTSTIKLIDKKVYTDEGVAEELDESVDYDNIREKVFNYVMSTGEIIDNYIITDYDYDVFMNSYVPEELVNKLIEESGLTDTYQQIDYIKENYDIGVSKEIIKFIFDRLYANRKEFLEQELSMGNKVYRMIATNEPLEEVIEHCKTNGIGNCWAKDKGNAFSYFADGGQYEYIFEAEVDEKDVDWERTMLLRMSAENEDEIRLLKNAKIKVLSVSDGNSNKIIPLNIIMPVGDLHSY